jgi:hypothetical protein
MISTPVFHEQWNQEEYSRMKAIFQHETFAPFHGIADSMFDFLLLEKLHLYMGDGTRKVVDENGEIISGYKQTFDHVEDEYHPQNFGVFQLSGFWIPESEGELFTIDGEDKDLFGFRRESQGINEVLFIVHPKSESLFAPLIARFSHSKVVVSALALSSFRTLLVSIPQGDCSYTIAFAKVSLDERINSVSRILSRKESGQSIATNFHFQKRLLEMCKANITSLAIMEV